mmetsp:Transcript_23332/g.44417  ORF Transcript_23332/g.44417 Transcript_23332/m.44417 type:complete len:184 (+) Transcript_23332:97-648(+)|eukprot:scaffold75_cov165-Amphora_coffeaeformis.AAC.19
MRLSLAFISAFLALPFGATAFVTLGSPGVSPARSRRQTTSGSQLYDTVTLTVDMPPTGSKRTARMKIEPALTVPSEIIEVRYKVPFGLNVEPKDNLAVCTKDGPGGEKVGDILRYTSQWTLGLPQGDGLITTAAAFSGSLKWGCNMFDVLQAKSWEQVVEALVSNTADKTDEVLLIFERPLEN